MFVCWTDSGECAGGGPEETLQEAPGKDYPLCNEQWGTVILTTRLHVNVARKTGPHSAWERSTAKTQ